MLLRAGLFSQTKFNTSLNPLSTEVRRVEYRNVLAEEVLEHPRQFLRQGQDERLAILPDAIQDVLHVSTKDGAILRLDLLIDFELGLSFAVCCPAKETALVGGRVNHSGITRSRA